jgi:dihydroflavonol-4-reductase
MGKMIFVTGGTGLVGIHVLFNLVSKGIRVKALKRETSNIGRVKQVFSWYSGDAEELFSRIEWFNGELTDVFSLENAFKDVEIIYNCAGMVSFESSKRKELIHNNIDGTANLVNAALSCGVKRICHVSSNAALGKAPDGSSVSETTSWIPTKKASAYSESKFFSEAEIWRGKEEGLEVIVVNPPIIVGPGNWESSSARFFPLIDNGFRFYTNGKTGFVDVRDVADAIILLTESPNFDLAKNQRFLICGENLGYRDFFILIADALGKPRPSLYVSGIMLQISWLISSFWHLVSRRSVNITKDTVTSSMSRDTYDGSKITRMFGFNYRSIREAVQNTAGCFLREKLENQA